MQWAHSLTLHTTSLLPATALTKTLFPYLLVACFANRTSPWLKYQECPLTRKPGHGAVVLLRLHAYGTSFACFVTSPCLHHTMSPIDSREIKNTNSICGAPRGYQTSCCIDSVTFFWSAQLFWLQGNPPRPRPCCTVALHKVLIARD